MAIAAATFLALAAIIFGVVRWFRIGQRRMDTDIAEIQRMGIPTDYNVIHSLYPRKGSDAYDDYINFLHVVEAMSPHQIADTQQVKLSDSLAPLGTRKAAADRLRPLFKHFIVGTKKDRWNLGRAYADDDSIYPWPVAKRLDQVFDAAFTYCQIARADGENGNLDLALDELRTTERFAKQSGENPIAVAQIRSISLERRTLLVCRQLLIHYAGDREKIKAIESYVDSLPSQPNARNAVIAEFLSAAFDLRDPMRAKSRIDQLIKQEAYDRPRVDRKIDQAFDMYLDAFRLMPKDPNDYQGLWRTFVAAEKKYPRINNGSDDIGQLDMRPADAQWMELYLIQQVNRKIMKTACLMYLSHLDHGEFPKSLPMSPFSIDPFSGTPFVYKPETDSFVLYSVGPNGKDDGGKKRTNETNPNFDIGYSFPVHQTGAGQARIS